MLQAWYPHRHAKFLKRFAAARRPGTYLRIVEEREIGAGDRIEVDDRPGHGVTIALFAEAYLADRSRLVELLAADALSQAWRTWIDERKRTELDATPSDQEPVAVVRRPELDSNQRPTP